MPDSASSTSALETTSVSRYSSTAGVRPKRRDPVTRRLGVVDDPVDAVHRLAGERRRPGRLDPAREQDGGGVAPRAGRLRVGPAARLAVELTGEPDGDLGARRVVRARGRLEVHRRGAAGERRRRRR